MQHTKFQTLQTQITVNDTHTVKNKTRINKKNPLDQLGRYYQTHCNNYNKFNKNQPKL